MFALSSQISEDFGDSSINVLAVDIFVQVQYSVSYNSIICLKIETDTVCIDAIFNLQSAYVCTNSTGGFLKDWISTPHGVITNNCSVPTDTC